MLCGRDEELKLSKGESDCRGLPGFCIVRAARITARRRELGKPIE
jgi:hypothetical protein